MFDIFALPSTNPDPLPTVVLESMACGKPVVGYRHGGVCEMVKEGENGLLATPNQPAELSKAIQELADNAGVPVWNGLTNEFHPTQMLADLLTIEENFGHLKGLNFVYMGDTRNNLGNSLLVACAKMGLNFTACGPKDLKPAPELVEAAEAIAKETGSVIRFTEDVKEACTDADVIYTDIWVSMGEPDEIWEKRINELKKFQVNKEAMSYAKDTAIFLHCLPSFHDLKTTIGAEINDKFGLPEMEVTDEVFESPQSKVFDQAENRMHTIKAVMYATLK